MNECTYISYCSLAESPSAIIHLLIIDVYIEEEKNHQEKCMVAGSVRLVAMCLHYKKESNATQRCGRTVFEK